MQVAVTSAHEAGLAARASSGRRRANAARLAPVSVGDSVLRKQCGILAECGVVLIDVVGERFDPRRGVDDRRPGVGRGDAARELVRHHEVDRLPASARRSSVFVSSKRRMSTAHSTGSPSPPSASVPSRPRVMAMTPR